MYFKSNLASIDNAILESSIPILQSPNRCILITPYDATTTGDSSAKPYFIVHLTIRNVIPRKSIGFFDTYAYIFALSINFIASIFAGSDMNGIRDTSTEYGRNVANEYIALEACMIVYDGNLQPNSRRTRRDRFNASFG